MKEMLFSDFCIRFSHWKVGNCSVAQLCLTLCDLGLQHARFPCPSLSPQVHSNSCLLSQWYHPTISSSVTPFSCCLQSFPASGSFPMILSLVSISNSFVYFGVTEAPGYHLIFSPNTIHLIFSQIPYNFWVRSSTYIHVAISQIQNTQIDIFAWMSCKLLKLAGHYPTSSWSPNPWIKTWCFCIPYAY